MNYRTTTCTAAALLFALSACAADDTHCQLDTEPEVVAHDVSSQYLVVGDTVYWATELGIHRQPLFGSESDRELIVDQPLGSSRAPHGPLRTHQNALYWSETSFGRIRKLDFDTGAVSTVLDAVEGARNLRGFAFVGDRLFWEEYLSQRVGAVELEDGEPRYWDVSSDPVSSRPRFLAESGGLVYWFADGDAGLWALDPTTDVASIVRDLPDSIIFRDGGVGPSHAFWIEYELDAPGSLKRMELDGSHVETLAETGPDITHLRVQDDYLYYRADEQTIVRLPIAGGEPVPVACADDLSAPTIADGWLYWVEGTSTWNDSVDHRPLLMRTPL